MIPVTKPYLPPVEEYQKYLDGIWSRNWLTNNGPLVNELELRLKEFLQIDHLLFLGNGTLALQLAIKALDLKGEIITTPFSYVATTSAIVWEGCKPVFADIDSQTFNIDPRSIEECITDKTTGILATHVYGNPCDVEAIQAIAEKNGLKVIYDGAHAFNVKYHGKSVFDYGDISTCSFHATKVFHTIEGGAVMTKNPELLKKMAYLRNFGHDGPFKFQETGINAKNSEVHAAMGLAVLNRYPEIEDRRRHLTSYYDKNLKNLKGVQPHYAKEASRNYSYYPILIESEEMLVKMVELLEKNEIYPRRYFYPTLDELPYVIENYSLPKARDISKRILCLPLYYEMSLEEVDMICRLMLRVQNN